MTLNRRTLLRNVVVAGVTVAVAGCSGTSASGGSDESGGDSSDSAVVETTDVTMVNTQFDPRNVHVDAGATVTWTNEDSTGHTVTAASDNWSYDEAVDGGGETSYTFEDGGVYDVYCRYHGSKDLSGMAMKVAVGDASIASPLGGGDSGSSGGGGY
ncbi:MAG: plastocyanin/azurin family copper-binding protein [Haloarculaceae archaeon]